VEVGAVERTVRGAREDSKLPQADPGQLVSNFAHLARATDGLVPYFWYARENLLDYNEVEKPQRQRPEDAIQFVARYSPYYGQALVPDGWAQDIAKAIRKGATEIVDLNGTLYLKTFFGKLKPLA
jgi:hypothetical protein